MSPLKRSAAGTSTDPGPGGPAPGDLLEDAPGLADLVQAARHGDADARRAAAVQLGTWFAERPGAPEGGEVVCALVGLVRSDEDPLVRDAALAQLARFDRDDVVEGLVPHLASDDANLRNAVVETMRLTPVATGARMPDLLHDPDPDVRVLSVMVLAGLRRDQVDAWLHDVIENDPSGTVVACALNELISLDGPRDPQFLAAARERFPDDPYISWTVQRALASAGEGS